MTDQQRNTCTTEQHPNICKADQQSSSTITSQGTLEPSKKEMKMKAASVPIPQVPSGASLKHQISAPSYLNSLKENDAPPFVHPESEPKPRLIIREGFSETDVVEMIASYDSGQEYGLKKYLGKILVDREIVHNYALSEKNFLVSLLVEVIDYAAQHDYNTFKLSVMLTIYVKSHQYFKYYYWLSPVSLWNYFKELMIRHTIEDSPTGEEVFQPQECYDIMTHFHTAYLTNLPLIHIVTFGVYRLKFTWPYPTK